MTSAASRTEPWAADQNWRQAKHQVYSSEEQAQVRSMEKSLPLSDLISCPAAFEPVCKERKAEWHP